MNNEKFNKFKTVKLKVLKGDDEVFIFSLKNSSGSAFAISGTVELTIKENVGDSTTIYTKTITDSTEGNIWVSGKLVLVIPSSETVDLPSVSYFDIKQTNSGIKTTLVSGIITAIETPS